LKDEPPLIEKEGAQFAIKPRFTAARLLPEQLAEGFEFVTNFNESIFPAVIPGLAKREPGIHRATGYAA
jgi:hypothetical protein